MNPRKFSRKTRVKNSKSKKKNKKRVIVKRLGCCTSKNKSPQYNRNRGRVPSPNLALENIRQENNGENNSSSDTDESTGFNSPPLLVPAFVPQERHRSNNVEVQANVENNSVDERGNRSRHHDSIEIQPTELLNSSESSQSSNDDESISGSSTTSNNTVNSQTELPSFSIPKSTFKRIAKSALCKYKQNYRLSNDAAEMMQLASEEYIVEVFQDSNKCCLHRQRKTVSVEDMELALELRNNRLRR